MNNNNNNNIKIIEYNKTYAKAVADMWCKSKQGWNGENLFNSENQVITSEENSAHLKLYLAVDGDDVVGYCKLSEYDADKNALYIDLLNVRDDYHGKKVGKMLVLKALVIFYIKLHLVITQRKCGV